MTRVGRILKGLCALGLLAALAAGIPLALWHFIGWPLPHHVPSLAQLGHALDQRGIPDQTLIDALAAAVWVTWAVLVASIAVEVPAALAGRRAPRLPLAGIFQPVTGRLVAAVIVAALSFAPRTTQVTALGSLGGGLSTFSGRQPVATLVLTGATQPLLATSKPAAADLSTPDVAQLPPTRRAHMSSSAATRSGASPSDSSATRWIGRRSTSSTRAGPSPTGVLSPTRTGSTPAGPSSCPKDQRRHDQAQPRPGSRSRPRRRDRLPHPPHRPSRQRLRRAHRPRPDP